MVFASVHPLQIFSARKPGGRWRNSQQATKSHFVTHCFFMSDYDLRPGGSLKLKGGVAEGGIVKKYVSSSFWYLSG